MKRTSIFILLAFALFAFNCSDKKDDKEDEKEQEEEQTETGFNETCQPSTLPEGLEITIDGEMAFDFGSDTAAFNSYMICMEECTESDSDVSMECFSNCNSEAGLIPAGGAFSLMLYLTNTTSSTINYTVQPGDWFEPGSGDYQPMMSPMTISIEILAGETKKVAIPAYCLAAEKDAPDENSEYSLCEMIAEEGCLADIIDILETKDVGSFTFEQSFKVQDIIWKCTEGLEVNLDYLNALPDL